MVGTIHYLADKLRRRRSDQEQESHDSAVDSVERKPIVYHLGLCLKERDFADSTMREDTIRSQIKRESAEIFRYHVDMAAELCAQTRGKDSAWGYRDMYDRAAAHAFAALKSYMRLERCVAEEGKRLAMQRIGDQRLPVSIRDVRKYRDQVNALSHTIYFHAFHELERARDIEGLESICEKYQKRCDRFGLAFGPALDIESIKANIWFKNMVYNAFKGAHRNIVMETSGFDDEVLLGKARHLVDSVEESMRPSDVMLPRMNLSASIAWQCKNMGVPQPFERFLDLVAQEGPMLPRIPGRK